VVRSRHVGKSPSRFDLKKLENLNGHYIREADDARLAELVAPRARVRRWRSRSICLRRAMPSLKPAPTISTSLASGASFLFRTRPLDMDADARRSC
jgi:glutamyl-tRNA synthetase